MYAGSDFIESRNSVTYALQKCSVSGARSKYTRPVQALDGSQPDEFNAINHANVSSIVGVASSPIFGRADSAGLARTLQISVKYAF
jgi:hypothetical protein